MSASAPTIQCIPKNSGDQAAFKASCAPQRRMFGTYACAPIYAPRSKRHENVEPRPYRRENPVWRVERRLGKARIPCVRERQTAEGPRAERQQHEDDEGFPAVHGCSLQRLGSNSSLALAACTPGEDGERHPRGNRTSPYFCQVERMTAAQCRRRSRPVPKNALRRAENQPDSSSGISGASSVCLVRFGDAL